MAAQPGNATVSVALFASGSGSNAAALLDHRYSGAVRPHYRCLIGNNSRAPVMELARARGVPAYHVSRRTDPVDSAYVARLTGILTLHDTELIVLAGYMKLLPGEIVRRWRGRILNIHPALLPRHGGRGMYGMAPHRAVLAAGERDTGVTVHLVDEQYDGGPIILQRRVPVRADDSAPELARRVLAVEHDTYWRAVEQVAAELADGAERAVSGSTPAPPGTPVARLRQACGAAPEVPAAAHPSSQAPGSRGRRVPGIAPGAHRASVGEASGTAPAVSAKEPPAAAAAAAAPCTEAREAGSPRTEALP